MVTDPSFFSRLFFLGGRGRDRRWPDTLLICLNHLKFFPYETGFVHVEYEIAM